MRLAPGSPASSAPARATCSRSLAYLLSNKEITDDAGRTFGATRFICDRLGVGNLATLITNQFSARPLIIQMLGYARGSSRIGQESSISYIILSWLERSLGRSQVPWIAQFEQLLVKNNQYENFSAFVAETTASDGDTQQWTEIRNDAALAHPLLVQGLHKFLPQDTQDRSNWRRNAVRLAEQKKYRARGGRPSARQRGEGPPSPEGSITRLS